METKCGIRKCGYSTIWRCGIRAYAGEKAVWSTIENFCFWHYTDALLGKIKVRDFGNYKAGSHSDLPVKVVSA